MVTDNLALGDNRFLSKVAQLKIGVLRGNGSWAKRA